MSEFRELYVAEQLPVLQNRTFQNSEDAVNCMKGDMVLVQDMETGLVFNRAFREELVQYNSDYQNEQAVSGFFREHLNNVSRIIRKHFGTGSLIEVGCGKGFFLERLETAGFHITGIDPAYEGSNPAIIKDYFTPGTGLHGDGIILRHVLEHIKDPVSFLSNISLANGRKGRIYIEVPCFDWICNHRAWFDVFYEHVNYFRLNDFNRIFGTVHESGHIFGGQYLYVVADLASFRNPVCDQSCVFEFPPDFLDTVKVNAHRLKTRKDQREKRIVVWGGASKGVIFSLFMHRAGVDIDFVVDINPAKQGRYLPVTGLLVHSPEDMAGQIYGAVNVFVMNSNYLPEIKQLTKSRYNYLTVEN